MEQKSKRTMVLNFKFWKYCFLNFAGEGDGHPLQSPRSSDFEVSRAHGTAPEKRGKEQFMFLQTSWMSFDVCWCMFAGHGTHSTLWHSWLRFGPPSSSTSTWVHQWGKWSVIAWHMDVSLHPSACMDTQSATLPSPTVDDPHSRQTTKMFHCSDPGRWPLGLPAKRCVESCCHSLRRYIYMYMYIFIYLFTEKDAVRSPFFHVSENAVFLLHHVRSFMFIYLLWWYY